MAAEPPYPDVQPPQLVLLRHGETEWSRSGRHTGATALPLTARGEERARAVAAALAGRRFGLVLSSPRRRALRTAELAGFGDRIEVTQDLAEFDYGAYEGLTSEQIHERRPGWDLWRDGTPPGDTPGESPDEVRRRVEKVIRRAEQMLALEQDVLVVAHGHVLRALAAAWVGLPPDGGARLVLSTAGLGELGYEHGNRVIDGWNFQP